MGRVWNHRPGLAASGRGRRSRRDGRISRGRAVRIRGPCSRARRGLGRGEILVVLARTSGTGDTLPRQVLRMAVSTTLPARPALFERAAIALLAFLVLLLCGLAGCRRRVVPPAEQAGG